MESQDKEEEYKHSVWEIYRREWATASSEKKVELNKRMLRWQELMKNGLTASQAYYKVMQGESGHRVAEEPSDKHLAIPSAPRMRKAPFIILGLALVAAVVYCVVVTGERNALNTELESVRSELNPIKQTLASTQTDLALAQTDLSSTKQTLTSTQTELGSTKQALASTQGELSYTKQALASTQEELSTTNHELSSLQATLSNTQKQVAVAKETLGGLGITLYTSRECSDVALIDNPIATNPSWNQLMAFLSQDQTEKHTYIANVYDCTEFSTDVHNNAEAAGIRAAVVHVDFKNEEVGHALNAFLTNCGLVYVDCTEEPDTIARVKTGKEYGVVAIGWVTERNVRDDYWWDAISSYSYFPSKMWWGIKVVTSSIIIYW